jgi:hypothetical protein
MLRAVSAAALVAVAGAKANEYVVASSVPEPVDGDLISFQHVTHKSAVIHWVEPGLGKWRLPIDGYRIKLRTTRNFPREAAATHKVRRPSGMARAAAGRTHAPRGAPCRCAALLRSIAASAGPGAQWFCARPRTSLILLPLALLLLLLYCWYCYYCHTAVAGAADTAGAGTGRAAEAAPGVRARQEERGRRSRGAAPPL